MKRLYLWFCIKSHSLGCNPVRYSLFALVLGLGIVSAQNARVVVMDTNEQYNAKQAFQELQSAQEKWQEAKDKVKEAHKIEKDANIFFNHDFTAFGVIGEGERPQFIPDYLSPVSFKR